MGLSYRLKATVLVGVQVRQRAANSFRLIFPGYDGPYEGGEALEKFMKERHGLDLRYSGYYSDRSNYALGQGKIYCGRALGETEGWISGADTAIQEAQPVRLEDAARARAEMEEKLTELKLMNETFGSHLVIYSAISY